MSTEIKNTLFRFVTMRAPELSDDAQKENRFVFCPDLQDSIFYQAVKNRTGSMTKWNAMVAVAKTFVPLDPEELKQKIGKNQMEFATWIAKNRRSFKTTELLQKCSDAKDGIPSDLVGKLWDNLFYQVITQKDFYIKEAIMQLLISNHVILNRYVIEEEYTRVLAKDIKNRLFETDLIKNIVNAKVVLPKELFDDTLVQTSQSQKSLAKGTEENLPVSTIESKNMRQFSAIADASFEIDRHLKLRKEIENIEKNYRQEYNEAYKIALQEHQDVIEPILEKYNQSVEDAKRDWCSVTNSSIPYDATNPCHQPPAIQKPTLPKFKFEFANELDLKNLESLLSEESYHTLLEILEIDNVNGSTKARNVNERLISSNTLGFTGVLEIIQENVNSNSQTIINNTPSQNTTTVSIGGVTIPVSDVDTPVPFSYELCATRRAILTKSYVDFKMAIHLPDASWQIASVASELKKSSGAVVTSSLFTQARTGDTINLTRLLNQERTPEAEFLAGISDLTITVKFTNGAVKSFSSGFWNSITCVSGTFTGTNDGSGGSGNPANPSGSATAFIPSGFGVKQLGIADYKKVEQTVQGYVEGDVAHIENVMAREYKEKATRKLRRSENTTTTSSETEREQLTDTTSTDRFEMQTEVAKVLQEGKDFAAGASFDADLDTYKFGTNVNMATHSSKEESNHQAIIQAKEVTERAMERIVTKVKEERITKIVEEFEENNKHGFDNTKGDKHVVGVFRWVDKIYKNQVLNYGKRLMFEFMVPEPAKLHLLGMTENRGLTTLVKPVDPRSYVDATSAPLLMKLDDHLKVSETTAKYWGSVLNVELSPMPEASIYIGKAFSYTIGESDKSNNFDEIASGSEELKIPEGYFTKKAKAVWHGSDGSEGAHVAIAGGLIMTGNFNAIDKFKGTVPVSYSQMYHHSGSVNFSIECGLLPEAMKKWQQETFKAIIDAYEEALTVYNQKLAEENALGIKIKGENPGFYRQIENTILRKNCISYIIDQNENAKRTYGKDMFKPLRAFEKRNFQNHEVNVGPALDDYAAFVKFIEQAFEWEIMSYNFYPYYWGDKKDWSALYQYDNNDPLFRSFMQAGMARVIVTVRPGFEDAVNYYMQTGNIWNGGEVPIIEDKLFMSIVDELAQTPGQKEGKAWATRLPTALTILQAQTIGLVVEAALPFDDDLSDFENPDDVPQSDGLNFSDAQLEASQKARIVGQIKGNQDKEAKIVLRNLDETMRNLTYCDVNGNWELNDLPVGKYQLVIDANNDFPATEFGVAQGSKEQIVELSGDQTLEINLELKKL